MEAGRYKHGLQHGVTNDGPQVWFDLGDRGPTHQICLLHTCQHQVPSWEYTEIYIACVLCLHGVPKTIIFDWGSQFVARFWEQLQASLGSHLIHSSAYHPQMNGQTERVNQILEDMLRAYVMEYQGSWDKNLPWAMFSYNNSYKESLKIAPFEVLYGWQCRRPLNWIEPGEKVIFGPNLVEEAEVTVCHIQDNLKATKSRQETYANKRRRPLEFKVRDHV
jgi:hypothetical protein